MEQCSLEKIHEKKGKKVLIENFEIFFINPPHAI